MSSTSDIPATFTKRQRQALAILATAEKPLRNKDFHERFEIDGRRTTGWAEALGPCTKARDHDPESLWARGLVSVIDSKFYTITAHGLEVLRAIGTAGIATNVKNDLSSPAKPADIAATSGLDRHEGDP